MFDLFLFLLGLIWIFIATLQDLRKREIDNLLSFSLIIFGAAYVIFYSLVYQSINYFLIKTLGLAIFIGLGYALYYGRFFAGGDAKLIMGLGIILTLSMNIKENLYNYGLFLFLLFFFGGFYGLAYSVFIAVRSKDFFKFYKKKIGEQKSFVLIFAVFSIISVILPLYLNENLLFIISAAILILPFLFLYAKTIEENCMIKKTSYNEVTVGDWLNEKVRVGNKVIMPNWEGLTEKQILLIKKYRKNVMIKNGIPFVPAFFMAYIVFYGIFLGILGRLVF